MNLDKDDTGRPSVAVVGSGVSGLTAAYLLQRRYDVHLFEADDRVGGHSHTHDVASAGTVLALDSGFIVHNDRTYPQLTRLFGELGVVTQDAEMSMSIRCEGCGLEYSGARGPRGLFAQPSSLVRPRFLGMLREVTAFHRRARALLEASNADADADAAVTYGEFLSQHRHSAYFVDHFAVPLVSAVWSSGRADALGYPARYLFRFLDNHGMLSVHGSPQWRTVVGGSRTYVERAVKGLTSVRTSTPVRGLRRHGDGVEVRDDADTTHQADHVVVATHADQALRLIEDPTPAETEVLGAFRSSVNAAVLHTDSSLLPRSAGARASWNHLVPHCGPGMRSSGRQPVTVSYHLNRLHRLGAAAGDVDYVVTLGAGDRIHPDAVIDRMVYEHPVYTPESVAAQHRLPELATQRTAFAGAWQGWGFHEDGCVSGVRAAEHLGVPW